MTRTLLAYVIGLVLTAVAVFGAGIVVGLALAGTVAASRAAPESIPAVSRPVAGSVTLDDLAQRGQPDSDHPGAQPAARGRVTPSPSPTLTRHEATTKPRTAPILRGVATWFRSPAGVSAAGPDLRAALGPGWRGTVVTVRANGHTVVTQLGDWCACPERLIDLHAPLFARLAPLSRGVLTVTVAP